MLDKQNKADEITRKALSGEEISEGEFRYVMMFNLTAMTQILWELTDGENSKVKLGTKEHDPDKTPIMKHRNYLERLGMKLLVTLSLATFAAGLAVGYLMP